MKTIYEKSAEYSAENYPNSEDMRFACEMHFKAGAEWMSEELIRWNDPKQELPETNVSVLIKATDQLGNEAIYLGSREGTEFMTDGGVIFGIDSVEGIVPDMDVKVIGWRPIYDK